MTEIKYARYENILLYLVLVIGAPKDEIELKNCAEFCYIFRVEILDEDRILIMGPNHKQVSRFNLKTGNAVSQSNLNLSQPFREICVST